METKVLTQEEIQQLNEIKNIRTAIVDRFGVLEVYIQELTLQKDALKEELKKLREKEAEIGAALQQKYGEGTIDLDKGEFTSN